MTIELVHKEVRVRVHEGPYLESGRPSPDAVKYYSAIIAGPTLIRRFAAKQLLDRYNDVWLDDEIGPLDETSFCNRLTNPVIVLTDEVGSAEVRFDDNGLFGGHRVEVSIENGKPISANILG